MSQKIEISSRTIIFTVFFILSLKVIWEVRELIFGLLLAFILMSALKPAVNYLEKGKIPRLLSTIIVFISAIFGVLFLFAVVVPPLLEESLIFVKSLPILISNIFPMVSDYFNISSLTSFLPDITQNIIQVITRLFSNVIFIVSILFFTFYFLVEEKFLQNFLYKFLNEKKAGEIVVILNKAEKRLSAWMWGEIVLMTLIGLATYFGLFILQMKYVLPLAVLAGILEIVPMIGPIISAIPAVLVALAISPVMAVYTIVLYILIQQLENNLVVPMVMRKAVGLNPIFTLIALTVGGKLGGFLGILLSVPIALILETILVEISRTKD
ncbi:hypothetical protein A3C23_04020 [Candidatus Roizmanbacteria bacterium RIFCSPHIGHO2_02_FULL_37_13b]|uniref:AI-2E family transporter n=1 Tax=Candidatus Roizmanbacteria bacterium RIFCSPLOWO2_02_FULL_36_11 TaxID=1802071 RepID=A0A1F7JGY9_9BACT|nr:MAG: hypothetical protein A3C23_04020 [Candidatus Roizmanbacteria bacterium RIFCSPHIGHO2_02_FULL_37_13b]OGK54884.1 MAG: hypothetical protein A3H78_00170 [Candidatus Roizmanbacteria bacterium RIFCSPLOWO2_02_FULL_36_11]